MKELAKESWNYSLLESESGDFIFNVVSGSVGLYEIKISLTPDEIRRYTKEGNSYLAILANEIRSNESNFQTRKVA
ncbi:hypothetical protein [Spirosoma endophyticum]|uniref:Uncharacterized protein n=1 Tax=Spirosoma endophyticum TaxID=662367 RepID=A0A1I1U5J1_9BACT|nr:hypothetical protein [Spirosoma endophyticum]SFD63983.1 hypothetical protein SAMN05216167_10662 [Spirosoma endophyticum]